MKKPNIKNLTIKTLSAILILAFCSCEHKDDDVSKPRNVITPKEARAMQDFYKKTRAVILKDTFGYQDVRDVTFSLSEIEQYIDFLKHEMKETDPSKIDLRIYFGAYPPTPDRKFGLSTVFIAPVVEDGKQEGAMFFSPVFGNGMNYPLNRGTGGEPPNDY